MWDFKIGVELIIIIADEIKNTKASLRVIAFHNSLQIVISEDKLDSVLCHAHAFPSLWQVTTSPGIAGKPMTVNHKANYIAWICKQAKQNGQRLASVSIQKGVTVEACDSHT